MHALYDQRIFHALRQEFILDRDVIYPYKPEDEENRVKKDFNYGRYLSMCMGETLAEVVEVSVPTWACMGGKKWRGARSEATKRCEYCGLTRRARSISFEASNLNRSNHIMNTSFARCCRFLVAALASAFYIIMLIVEDDTRILAWFMVGCGWFVTAFNFMFEKKLIQIRDSFVPVKFLMDHSHHVGVNVDKGERQSLTLDESLPAWCSIDPDKFGLSKRSKNAKCWLGPAPNRQQLLFWAQQFGADFHILLFRITLLFNGLYTAVMAVTFVPGAYKEFVTVEFVIFAVLAVIPLYLQITGKRR